MPVLPGTASVVADLENHKVADSIPAKTIKEF